MNNFRDDKNVPLFHQIAEDIKALIINNTYNEGELLPSIRNLAFELRVNNNTVKKAYDKLENEGYIYTVIGKGKFVQKKEFIINNSRQEIIKSELLFLLKELSYLGVTSEELKILMNKGNDFKLS